jgi:protein-S-isoprenylcysteine O-methyltransferase Ste14
MPPMRAAKWEFEYRFFVIGAIFFLGFFLYNVDPVPFSVALIRIAAPSVDLDREGILWFKLLIAFGALLVFLSALFRTWATAYLRTEVVHDAPLHAEALVADGPYRYVRNPLYFANVPMAAGMGLMASRAGWFFMVVAMIFAMLRLIGREEEELLKTQGEPYRAYLRAVPRFWPALTARVAPGGRPARWAQAFAGEMFIWLIGAAELCFAITLNLKLSGIVLAASFVVYFLAVYLVKKSAGQSAPSA